MSLQQFFIDTYTSDTLADFIRLCVAVIPSSERPTRKDQRAKALEGMLINPQHLQQLWAALDDLSRKAVAAAYHNGGDFVADAFIAHYGTLPARPQKSAWYYAQDPILLDLFIHQARIPPDLMEGLADLVPPPERFQVVGTADINELIKANGATLDGLRVAETEEAGWLDLLMLLQLWDQGDLTLNSTGEKLTPTSVTTLLGTLLHGDFFQPADLEKKPRWRVLGAQDGGAARAKPKAKVDDAIRPFGLSVFAKGAGLVTGRRRGELTERGRALLARQSPELLLEAFETWTKEGAFDEITRIDAVKGLRARGIKLTKPGLRRERIVEALSWCPANVWISIADFYRALKIWHFDFEIEAGGLEKLYVGYRYGRSGYYEPWGSRQDMWLLTNGLYIKAVLWEYLAVIGALDIAYLPPGAVKFTMSLDYDFDEEYFSRYDGLLYFRINALGAYLFGQAGDYLSVAAKESPLWRVYADLRLKLSDPARLTPVVKTQLEQISVPEGEEIYVLDAQKLLLALEQGADLEALRDFLARNSEEPVPPEVNSWLDQVYDASCAFAIDISMLRIRATSEQLVQLVLTDAELAKFCKALGNRELVIPSSRETRFRNRLRELGYGLR